MIDAYTLSINHNIWESAKVGELGRAVNPLLKLSRFESYLSHHRSLEHIIHRLSVYTDEIYQYVPHKHAQFKGSTKESKV